MIVASTGGVEIRPISGSHDRSEIGAHHNAIGRFLSPGGGDPAVLAPFQGKHVGGVELETDPGAIVELWRQGELNYLEIYA